VKTHKLIGMSEWRRIGEMPSKDERLSEPENFQPFSITLYGGGKCGAA
jgi:hypothetical protein